jgi:micrococcal nuclease
MTSKFALLALLLSLFPACDVAHGDAPAPAAAAPPSAEPSASAVAPAAAAAVTPSATPLPARPDTPPAPPAAPHTPAAPQRTERRATVAPPATARWAASSRGSIYYPIACDDWRRLAPANLVFFASEGEAIAAGYRRTRSAGCASVPAPGTSVVETRKCTVERIIDGDTLVCDTGERVRLLLVDAPELGHERFGLRARLALEELLPVGATAAVETDVRQRDRYGRVLAYLHTDAGVMVNEALARRGYVMVDVHPPNVRHVERLRAAVAAAGGGGRAQGCGRTTRSSARRPHGVARSACE